MENERLLITLGEWPEVLDTEKGPISLPYRALARVLEPFLYEERTGWLAWNKIDMRKWLRRLCQ